MCSLHVVEDAEKIGTSAADITTKKKLNQQLLILEFKPILKEQIKCGGNEEQGLFSILCIKYVLSCSPGSLMGFKDFCLGH